jgi:hypothetical protein
MQIRAFVNTVMKIAIIAVLMTLLLENANMSNMGKGR